MRGGREKRKGGVGYVPLDSLPSKAASHGGRHERTFARRGRKEVSSHSTVSTQLFTMTSL